MRVPRLPCFFLVVLLTLSGIALSQQPCDPNLRTDSNNPNAYRLRDDRCEGVYIEGQSGNAGLLIASFTETFVNYRTDTTQPLIVDWTAPAGSRVKLRSYSLVHRRYYRMDTVRPVDQFSFSWPVSLLAALDLKQKQIGIVGWTESMIGNRKRDLYIPLRIGQQNSAARSKGLQLLIVPRLELEEVRWDLSLIGEDGRTIETLKSNEKLSGDYFPPNRAFQIPITELKKSGFYFLRVGAILRQDPPTSRQGPPTSRQGPPTSRQGPPTSTELWFYYSK